MELLLAIDFFIITIITFLLIVIKNYVKKQENRDKILKISALLIAITHYSSIVYHLIVDGTAIPYLESNPNLLIPIYPCNVMMIACIVMVFVNKKGKLFAFLVDYVFLVGLLCGIFGLVLNVDFIRDPYSLSFDIIKGLITHGIILFTCLYVGVFGYYKLDIKRNMKHLAIAVIVMLVFGLYCNLVFEVLAGYQTAYNVNSMFLLHSPFDDSKLLTYPLISLLALAIYATILFIATKIKKK